MGVVNFLQINGTLTRDGVISYENWEKADLKILFVLKETNKANQNVVEAIKRALVTTSSGWWRGKVLSRVGRWAFGLANYTGDVPSFNDAKVNGKEAIWSIAYINMRKTAGGASTNKKSFNTHVKEYAPFIRRQIELIKPDVVVLGGTYKPLKAHVFPELDHICKRIHKHDDMIFINVHHPAARANASDIYHQLMDSYHNYKSGEVKQLSNSVVDPS